MIARAVLPARWVEWNARTGAPFYGPFAHFRGNSDTRVWEYPWAAEMSGDVRGRRVLDVGGGLSGLAFVLGRAAEEVVVVDPDDRPFLGAPVVSAWARAWEARVHAFRGTVSELDDRPFDCAVCLSVIEHIASVEDRRALVRGTFDRLAPGGRFVVSLDLDLGLWPFSAERERPGLRNVSVQELLDSAPFELVGGIAEELYGLPGFAPDRVGEEVARGTYLVNPWGVTAACFVLRRP